MEMVINSGRIQYFDQYGSGPYLKPVHIGRLSPIGLGLHSIESHDMSGCFIRGFIIDFQFIVNNCCENVII